MPRIVNEFLSQKTKDFPSNSNAFISKPGIKCGNRWKMLKVDIKFAFIDLITQKPVYQLSSMFIQVVELGNALLSLSSIYRYKINTVLELGRENKNSAIW